MLSGTKNVNRIRICTFGAVCSIYKNLKLKLLKKII